jgi:hypothetical protein
MQLSQRPSPSITSPAGTRSAGIDIAFIFDGTAYHTARDEVSRIRPGTLQARCRTPERSPHRFLPSWPPLSAPL